MPDNINLRNLIQKSLRNTLTPEETHQLDNWEPADFQRLLSEVFADAEDFRLNLSLFLQAKALSIQLKKEFAKELHRKGLIRKIYY